MTITARQRCKIVSYVCAGALVCASGCALTSRSEPMQIRYFTLEDATRKLTPAAPAQQQLELRLGRVDASGGLSEELAVRTGDNELSYREDQRWTEKPEQFMRRSLERALFQDRGVTRAYSGVVPTLDVELIELAEVQAPNGTSSTARVRAVGRLHNERRGLCDETFNVEQPIAADAAAAPVPAVSALSRALTIAVDKLADRMVQCLASATVAAAEAPSAGGEAPQTARAARP